MSDAMTPVRRGATAWWIPFVLAIGCLFPVAIAALSQYGDARGNVVSACLQGQERLSGAIAAEAVLVEARLTAFPVGRLCVWEAADGEEAVQQTGWLATILGVIGAAGCVMGSVLAFRAASTGRRRITSLVPLAIALGLWLIIVLSAHSAQV